MRLIGRGGMGAIYEVRSTRLDRSFAMKVLIGDGADDPEIVARFRREADVIARIKHPNIVEVIDWDSLEDGSPCMVLEYLQGEDLAHRIREVAPLPWHIIAKVGDQMLSALSVAHAANVIHRDLKPQNIFLAVDDTSEERAKLLDFGVSKIRDSHTLVTTDARLLGTPSYMSPEQAEGRHDDVGPATDLWAMGTILYEMATGDLAFGGSSMPAVLYQICSRDADSVAARRADAPLAFTALIREALCRDLDGRISDADVFRLRLREALANVAPAVRYSDQVIVPRPTSPTPTPTRRKRYTGANDATVTTGEVAIAQTVANTDNLATQNADTLPVRRRSLRWLALAVTMAVMITAVLVIGSTGTEPAVVFVAPAAPPIDAGVMIDTAAAAVVVEPPKPRVTVKVPKKPRPVVVVEPPPPVIVKPETPPPPGCARFEKTDPKYKLCIYGDGGGM
ncbi:MAG: serine/threonine-protein kinase [Kofleriaceae bacterium]